MGRKSDTEILAGEISKLTAAVIANTKALHEAMGKSREQMEELAKQFEKKEPAPEGETVEQMVRRLSGNLHGAHRLPVAEGDADKPAAGFLGRVPFSGMLGGEQGGEKQP